MHRSIVQAATLPFQIVESMDVSCGYERSFKLCRHTILANRYLLGINTADVSTENLLNACRTLDMPQDLMAEFNDGLPDANLVLLGFEADDSGGALYKVYLEYWDRLREKLLIYPTYKEPHMLHKGFKWQYDRPEKNLVSWYQCLPGLTADEILQRVRSRYSEVSDPVCLDSVGEIIALAQRRAPDKKLLYVEVSEAGNPRKSFDLNLYPTGMRIKEITTPISDAAARLDVPKDKFARLMSIIPQKLFGHISAGIGRDGQEYFTIYYES